MDVLIPQYVFDKIKPFLPDGWDRVIFYAEYTAGSYSMRFYSKSGDKPFVDCFSLPGASKGLLIKSFLEIDGILSKNRNEKGINNSWTVFTMKVDADGHMKTEFDYEDHSDDVLSFKKKWENKYLR